MTKSLFLGVDPGKTGAIAFLDPVSMDLLVHDMPLSKTTTGKEEIDLRALAFLLSPISGFDRLIGIIERVSSRPNDSGPGAFTFGQGYGALRMGVIGHGYEDHYVTPGVWKKYFKLNQNKGVSRSYAQTRFPRFANLFTRVKDDGRAEAALIALYGVELFFRPTNPTP